MLNLVPWNLCWPYIVIGHVGGGYKAFSHKQICGIYQWELRRVERTPSDRSEKGVFFGGVHTFPILSILQIYTFTPARIDKWDPRYENVEKIPSL